MKSNLLPIAAAVLLTATATAQRGPAADPLVPANATEKIAAHTYMISDRNIGMVPNVGIVVGDRAALVIDPGLGRRNGETVLAELRKLTDTDEIYIASTHFHPEHTMGYVAFPPSAKYVNSTTQEQEFAETGMSMVERFAGFSPLNAELLAGAERRVADITFDREYTLDLGGVSVHMLVVGPTHTRGDTGFFVEGDRVLFAGDVVMNESFVAANDGSSVSAWLAAFDAFQDMDPAVIVPAHGEAGDGTLTPTQRRTMLAIQSRARALKAEGRSAQETGETVQREQQGMHPGWGRANGVAAAARVAWREAP